MDIVIFYRKNRLCEYSTSNVSASLFKLDAGKVCGVMSFAFKHLSLAELILFLKEKEVQAIYVKCIDEIDDLAIQNIGIRVETAASLIHDHFFNTFFFTADD